MIPSSSSSITPLENRYRPGRVVAIFRFMGRKNPLGVASFGGYASINLVEDG